MENWKKDMGIMGESNRLNGRKEVSTKMLRLLQPFCSIEKCIKPFLVTMIEPQCCCFSKHFSF